MFTFTGRLDDLYQGRGIKFIFTKNGNEYIRVFHKSNTRIFVTDETGVFIKVVDNDELEHVLEDIWNNDF